MGFNRFEALKKAIVDGNKDFAMMLADFHLMRGSITQAEYDELVALAYPVIEVSGDGLDVEELEEVDGE